MFQSCICCQHFVLRRVSNPCCCALGICTSAHVFFSFLVSTMWLSMLALCRTLTDSHARDKAQETEQRTSIHLVLSTCQCRIPLARTSPQGGRETCAVPTNLARKIVTSAPRLGFDGIVNKKEPCRYVWPAGLAAARMWR